MYRIKYVHISSVDKTRIHKYITYYTKTLVLEIWRWVQKQDIGPSPRYSFSMAFDSDSRKTIVFGGTAINFELRNDTWKWIDQVWTQIADTGPSPRTQHKMVYDSHRDKILLFGGFDGSGYKDDTWQYDGNEWVQIHKIFTIREVYT
jgi:hypothetical protein